MNLGSNPGPPANLEFEMNDLEQRIKTIEKVVETLYLDLKDIREVMSMHIKSHIAEYDPVYPFQKVDVSNGFSYTWGSYYRAPVNRKVKIDEEQLEIQSGETV